MFLLLLACFIPVPETHEATLNEWIRNGPTLLKKDKTIRYVIILDRFPSENKEWEHGGIDPRCELPPYIFYLLRNHEEETLVHEVPYWIRKRKYKSESAARNALNSAALEWAKEMSKKSP